MKVFSKIIIAAWLFATITSLHAFKVEKGFTSIFNGKDLTGWEGMPGMWMVKDGAITPKPVSYTHLTLPTICSV